MYGLKEYLSLSIIILLTTLLIFFLIKIKKKKFLVNLLDCDFSKIQSFHKKPVLKIGGIFIFFYITLSYLFFRDLLLRDIFYMSSFIFFFFFF